MAVKTTTPAPNNAQRVGTARKAKPGNQSPKGQNVPTGLKTPNSKHRPIGPVTARLMAACEAKRVAAGLSFAALAKETGVDKADLSRALALKEEPGNRTRGALVSYFGIADAADLTVRERELALQIETAADLRRAADNLERAIKLRVACGPPEVL